MNFTKKDDKYLLVFQKDERLVDTLSTFVREQNIRGGWISGLGGLQSVELGFYDLHAQQYVWRQFDVLLELTNLTGNIAYKDDELVLHLHATVSNADYQAYGGHVREAVVAGTVELVIQPWPLLARTQDELTGLNLLDI